MNHSERKDEMVERASAEPVLPDQEEYRHLPWLDEPRIASTPISVKPGKPSDGKTEYRP